MNAVLHIVIVLLVLLISVFVGISLVFFIYSKNNCVKSKAQMPTSSSNSKSIIHNNLNKQFADSVYLFF